VAQFAPFALFLQGRIAMAQNDWSRAATPMRKVLTDYPTAEPARDARLWLAEIAYRLADYDEAAEQFQTAAAEFDTLRAPWNTIVPLRQAQILAGRREWPEALAAARAILDVPGETPRRFEAEFVAGRALLALARLDEARAAFQRVIDDPNGSASETAAMAQFMIGETHRHQKQYMEAIRAYLKLDLLYDDTPWRAAALLEAGGCYESLQENDEARRLYQQLVSQFPASEQSPVAQQRLHRLPPDEDRMTATNASDRL
jgi:TolA-binding protein